jgi:hypothetical protein
MIRMKKVYKYYSRLEKLSNAKISYTKYQKFKIFLKTPYYYFMEYQCKRHFWEKFILKDMIESNIIFTYLDDNDFEYVKKGKYLRKIDTLDDYGNLKTLEEIKNDIQNKYVRELTSIFDNESNFDIAEYINMYTVIDLKTVTTDTEIYKSQVWELILRWCRELFYQECKKKFKQWIILMLSVFGIISGICSYFLIYSV